MMRTPSSSSSASTGAPRTSRSPLPMSASPPGYPLPAPTALPASAYGGGADIIPSQVRAALHARDWDAVSLLAVCNRGHSCFRLPAADGGLTPLHLVALGGCASAVSALLAAGANVDAVDVKMQTALHLAAGAGRLNAVKALLEGGATARKNAMGKTALHDAAWAGHKEVARVLVKYVDVNAVGVDGRAALHCASLGKDVAFVRELLQAGARVNVVDGQGRTPVDWAAQFGRASGDDGVVKVLREAGGKEAGGVEKETGMGGW